jgi:hypothetical protein
VNAVLDAGGEHHGLATLSEPMPVTDNIADELVRVHPPSQLALDVIAHLGMDAG